MERLMQEEEVRSARSTRDEGLRFARRLYLPRVLGLALGAVCIGASLAQRGTDAAVWPVLLLNTLAWPHLAYRLSRRSNDPYHAELRNLMVDSASGGAWIAAIGFNLVPSAVLFSMLAMDKASIGGWKFLGRCLAAQVAAAAVVSAALGFPVHVESSLAPALASLPLLIVYPVLVGITAYRLARRVRQQNLALAALSSIDGLSGLLNRMHWEKAVAGEFGRCRRTGGHSVVMMLDIDHFKSVNDNYGHAAGDEVIRSVAQILRSAMRMYDVAARYGGEEFGVILSGSSARQGLAIAERIRNLVESSVLEARHGVRGTVSIGVAAFDPKDPDHAAWIRRADEALYQAKGAGRNRAIGYANTLAA